jgi:hypothetical protein
MSTGAQEREIVPEARSFDMVLRRENRLSGPIELPFVQGGGKPGPHADRKLERKKRFRTF